MVDNATNRAFWIKAILLGLLSVAILVAGGMMFLSQMERAVWEESIDNVTEVTKQGSKAFEIYLDQGELLLEGAAVNFALLKSEDDSTIGEKLDLYESGDPSFAIIDLTHGTKHFNSQAVTDLTDEQKEMFSKLPNRGVLEPFASDYDGREVIGYYERFTFADGVDGMVIKTIPVTDFTDRFALSFYDGAGSSYIVNTDGEIIMRSTDENNLGAATNIFDVINDENSGLEVMEVLHEALEEGQSSGVLRLRLYGEDYIFAYEPLPQTNGWYLVSVIPDSVISEHASQMLMTTQAFISVAALALIIFIFFLLLTVHHRRQIKGKETEVRYRDHMFNLLANNTNDVFITVSMKGDRVLYVSPNIETVMGLDPEAVMKDIRLFREVINNMGSHVDTKRLYQTPLGESFSFEGSFRHPDTGETRWFLETIYHTELEGIERYIVVIADRTEERQKEFTLTEALEIAEVANDSKSTFLSNMSHDIRTPMNAIVGLATLLQRDAEDPELVRQHTRKITSSSQHLLGLINDVLDMSKIESGETSLNIGAFSLPELIDEVGTIMRPQANAKRQTFNIVVQDIQHEFLIGDKLRINQILINILSNAIKYTPVEGDILMKVQQLGEPSSNIARIRFVVQDNGIGMTEEYQEIMFEPFTREVRTVVNEIQGTGLGMAITKSLVDLMGGIIRVDSTLGEGTTFTLDFDLRIEEVEEEEDFWQKYDIDHALIVDDELDICTSIMSSMAGTGVNMEFALNGPTAVNMVKAAHDVENDFDVILLDWQMPEMNGIETARRIREVVPRDIPIMILTSYDYEDIRDEGLEAGIDGFLSKPFFLSTFKEVIRAIKSEGTFVKKDEELEEAEKAIGGKHFLYAEDNELNATILTELLSMEGGNCDRAIDGQQAAEAFINNPAGTYDAVLMDIQMPIMNGYEATKAIRESDHPDAKTIPIIALTANAFADDVRDALAAGMDAHIAKPVDLGKLAETLYKLWTK